MQDIKLNELTNDLQFQNFSISLVSGADYLLQKVKIKLQFFFQEWFLDTTKGMDYFNIAFQKNPDVNAIDNMLKATILEVEGIINISLYKSEFNIAQRIFTLNFKANSIYGEISFAKEFTI